MEINGKTIVLGVIGDPISHTLSPPIHNGLAKERGINCVYVPFHVRSEDLEAAVLGAKALGIRGLNVTIPHKEAIIPFLDTLNDTAKKTGAVNTVLFKDGNAYGYNTDVGGIIGTFVNNGVDVRGAYCAVIGAGGGARAAAVALSEMGAGSIAILNRTLSRAEELAERIRSFGTEAFALEVSHAGEIMPEIAIQATSVGLRDKSESPVTDERFFSRLRFAMDEVYGEERTEFLKKAERLGVRTADGAEMLRRQAREAFGVFVGE